MTDQEIIEGNKLIAEFMGYTMSSSDKDFTFYTHPDGKGIVIQSHHDYQRFDTHGLMEIRGFIFHRSWEWLMPVVERMSEKCQIHIVDNVCIIMSFSPNFSKIKVEKHTKIDAVHSAVIEFIKWYNSQN